MDQPPAPSPSKPSTPSTPAWPPTTAPVASEKADWCVGTVYIVSDDPDDPLSTIWLRGKQMQVCRRSLYMFPLSSCIRRRVIELVTWFAFDKFILLLIIFNSLCLASYDHRSEDDRGFNWVSDNIFDPILTSFFTLEFILKVIAFGFVMDETSYLRDAWNWLDFIVVITGNLQMTNAITSTEGVGFLRMFRILRPLRSLNAVPQMKLLVNTVLSSIPRLGNVSIMAAFLFCTFGILGISLFGGVFYRSCRTSAQPLLLGSNGTECWSWPRTADEQLCGGRFLCEAKHSVSGEKGYCGGHPQDPNEQFRPVFEGGQRNFPWCTGSEPKQVFPESEWICFDHMGTALITIFQCMTLEGWTDVMYRLQDGYGFEVATIYFFLLVPVTSFFLLNVALAVVDEAREDFAEEAAEEAAEEEEKIEAEAEMSEPVHEFAPDSRPSGYAPVAWMGHLVDAAGDVTRAMSKALDAPADSDDQEAPWLDVTLVRILKRIATNEVFTNIIMCFIAANVVTMMMDGYPPILVLQDFLATCEILFLVIFCVEMCIMLGAYGPCRYLRTPVMCFDGIIVTISVVQVLTSPDGEGGPFTALRTLRLFRVLNKLASRWPSFRVLLKAMLYTGKSLSYWIVLFSLVLYICTLMFIQLFQSKFHFVDVDTLGEVAPDQGQPWCAGTEGLASNFRQDCIPRAHFDTFLWSLVSIFQIMTGENWNMIMYAGMRAQGWTFGVFFVLLIIFGQILFLSLFLSMLLSRFDEVQDEMERKEAELRSKTRADEKTHSLKSLFRAVSSLRNVATTWREAVQERKVAPDQAVGESVAKPMWYYENNIVGTLNILKSMEKHGCKRLVFSSSATVYRPCEEPIDEQRPLGCTNPYGWTKFMIEQILRDFVVANPSFSMSILRYFNPVGAHPSGRIGENPHGPPNNLMPFVQQVAVGRREALSVFGSDYSTHDGTGVRDYIHVDDLAEGHICALQKLFTMDGGCITHNLGSGTGYSVLDMVKAFEEACGKKIPYKMVDRRPGDLGTVVANPGKAKADFDWQTKRGLQEMCNSAWKWQSNNPYGYEEGGKD